VALRFGFCIAILLQLAASVLAEASEHPSLEIYLYNHAGVPREVISQAEEDATRIFRLAGLRAMWVNCSTTLPAGTNCNGLPQSGTVIVQLVHDTKNLRDDVFGAAFLGQDGSGRYVDVYYDRVNELHRGWSLRPQSVLSHVIAHEIGHLLLGLNSHSQWGIMRGLWEGEEMKAVERGRLLFSSEQSRRMREKLTAIWVQPVSGDTPRIAASLVANTR